MASAASLTAGLSPEQLLVLKDQNHDAEVYICAAVFTVLTILAVFVRVTSRHMKNVAVGVDDILVILALVGKHFSPYKKGQNVKKDPLDIGDYYSTNDIYLRW